MSCNFEVKTGNPSWNRVYRYEKLISFLKEKAGKFEEYSDREFFRFIRELEEIGDRESPKILEFRGKNFRVRSAAKKSRRLISVELIEE